MTRTVSGTIGVWITPYSDFAPEDLSGANDDRIISQINVSEHDMSGSGWTRLADASVSFVLPSIDALIEAKVVSLRAEKQKLMAETQLAVTELDNKIQKLLAITYTPESA